MSVPKISREIAGLVAGVFGIFLLGYVIVRAMVLPFTFDESLTYLDYVRLPVSKIVSPPDAGSTRPFTANNHILNTVLAKGSSALFGVSEFALRLPNVVAFAVFLFFLWRLLRKLARPGIALAGFLAIAANPFLLDWFSLCRGYGLSLALSVAGVYFVVTSIAGDRSRRGTAALGFVCLDLAVAASFVLFYVLFAAAATAVAIAAAPLFFRRRGAGSLRSAAADIALPAAACAVPLALFAPILSALSRAHELWFGGKTGFWSDTAGSLVESSLYGATYADRAAPIVLVAVGLSAVLVGAAAAAAAWRHAEAEKPFLAIAAILAASAGETIAAHWLFGVKYLITRTALLFIPLFFLAVAGALEVVGRSPRPRIRAAALSFAVLVGAASIFHFAAAANLKRPLFWAYDMDTPAMLTDLAKFRKSLGGVPEPFRLGVDARLAPSIEFYREVLGIGWLAPMDQQSPWRAEIRFVYLQPFEREDALRHGVRILRVYEQTGNILGLLPRRGVLAAE